MTITNGLITRVEYSAYTGSNPATGARHDQWDDAITVASRWVEKHTGRQFHKTDVSESPTASARYFHPVGDIVSITDCYSVTSIAVDYLDTATTYTTLTSDQYQLLPMDGRDDLLGPVPYIQIRQTQYAVWPTEYYRERPVKVTGLWGWSAVPDDVKRATAIFVQDLLRDTESNFGGLAVDIQNGIVLGSRVPARTLLLLDPYRRLSRAAGPRVA